MRPVAASAPGRSNPASRPWLSLLLCAALALSACAGRGPQPTADAGGAVGPLEAGLRVEWASDPDPPQPGQSATLRYRFVAAQSGRPIADLPLDRAWPLHLFAVSADLAEFRHLLPVLGADGSYAATFTPPRPGIYRPFAEFRHADRAVIDRRELAVAVGAAAAPPAALSPDRGPTPIGGLVVELLGPQRINAGGVAPLTLVVSRDGRPVTDLEPYLGAAAHITILAEDSATIARTSSKGLDTHDGEQGASAAANGPFGPRLGFAAAFPRAGLYKLWVELRHEGRVIAIPFAIEARP